MHDDLKARLLATFQVEAREHLQTLADHLLALERTPPPEQAPGLLEAAFRATHTLKGAARSVSLVPVETLCQAMEATLRRLTRGEAGLTAGVLAVLQAARQALEPLVVGAPAADPPDALIRRLHQIGMAETPNAARSAPEPPDTRGRSLPEAALAPPAETIRVAAAKLDGLLLQMEELLVFKLAAAERVPEARSLLDLLSRCQKASSDETSQLLRTATARTQELLSRLNRDEQALAKSLTDLQGQVRDLRMSPAAAALEVLPRMVRDLASAQEKEADLQLQGADLEVDRKILEGIKDPLIHLLRNAVDHGIEPPEARVQAGKARRGHVSVSFAPLEGDWIEIRVEDDGAGLDVARVRAAAVRLHLLTAAAVEALSDDEALQLIFRSGLSTSPVITPVSGQGLGLAIVKERVEGLGGQVAVTSRPGAGTSVGMTVPASIATFRGLLVRAGDQPFLLPLQAVERTLRLAPDQVRSVEDRPAVLLGGNLVPVARLDQVLGLAGGGQEPDAAARLPAVVLRSGDKRAALLVSEVVGTREVLVREFGPPLGRVRHVAGTGLMGTGQLVLILRPQDLVQHSQEVARPAVAPAAPAHAPHPVVLVVDDSITTRTMERNLLEAAGFRVQVAVDGMDAWVQLKSTPCDLVVSDVDMPRLDGFDLTTRIRADPNLKDLPVVLVTALEAREDRERGLLVGANAYVVKSSFDQSNLLAIIQRLL